MTANPTLSRLARHIARGNTLPQVPRTPQMHAHLLTVTHVDTFSGVVGVQFPDPSGFIVQGVRYMQSYSPMNSPSVGDTVHAIQYGTDLWVVGQHIVPTNFVTL